MMANGIIRIPGIKDRNWYTTAEVAERIGKSQSTVYRMIRKAKEKAREEGLYSPYFLNMRDRVPKDLMNEMFCLKE